MLVTHIRPDLDAVGGVWMVRTYVPGAAGMPIRFVSTAADPASYADAAYVVDIGRVHAPDRGRFDHHQFTGLAASETSATQLVWDWLAHGADVAHLAPLIRLITAGDTGKREADGSRQLGIHALLRDAAHTTRDDAALLSFGSTLLDSLDRSLRQGAADRAALAAAAVWRSPDRLLIALDGANPGVSAAAYEAGYAYTVFANDTDATITRGIARAPGCPHHMGEVVQRTLRRLGAHAQPTLENGAIIAELSRWFCHPAGIFAGRGTSTAPNQTPCPISLVALAQALYESI